MQLKYMGSKSAPHVDRLLGDVAVLHSPFFGSGKLEYYLATRRPALKVRSAFEPVANLHRCYLRQDPVFLRSLLRLVGRKADRRFHFSHLLPGTQRGRAGRQAACDSFSGKWGFFTQQRPLVLSSVRRLQRPPPNVTVRRQDALAYLRALPRLAPRQAIYADSPYIFPARSRHGLPLGAWELYSRAGSITRLCSGKNSSKPELLVVHLLRPQQDCSCNPTQDCQARARPAPGPTPGPRQARANPTLVWRSDFRLRWRESGNKDRSRGAGFAFPSLLRTEAVTSW